MAETGLLVTMCTGFPGATNSTTCDSPMDHVSASWMSNALTGFRVLPTPYGTALDPTHVTVRCAFPVDASSDSRDGAGCGPHSLDPVYGSQGYDNASLAQRAVVRVQVAALYAQHDASTWSDLACSELVPTVEYLSAFGGPMPLSLNATNATTDDLGIRSYYDQLNALYEPFLGHPMCKNDAPVCVRLHACGALDYLGPTSWPPDAFDAMIDTQRALHRRMPALLESSWNEIILDVVEQTPSIQAAFWLNDTRTSKAARALARAKARNVADRADVPVLVAELPWLRDDPDAAASPWNDDDDVEAVPGVVFVCDAAASPEETSPTME